MKIKKIHIRSSDEFDADLRAVARAFDAGQKIEPKIGVFFENLDVVRSILTEKRLQLWRVIRDEKPESISDLADKVGRGFRSVHRDLEALEFVGLIRLKKTKGKRGDLRQPVSLADKVELSVA